MINTLKKLFGIGPEVNYAELVKNGDYIKKTSCFKNYPNGRKKYLFIT